MNYSILQNAVTTATQETYPDGIITKVGNDKYTYDEAQKKWHQQCTSLESDNGTIRYKCAVVDSNLNIVDNLVEFKDKGAQAQE